MSVSSEPYMLFWNCPFFYSLDLLGCANFAFRREAYVGPARRRDIVSIAQWIEWHDSAPVVGPTMEQLFGSFQETFCPSPCASRSVILVDCAIYTCARPKMSQWRVQRPCSTVKYTLYVKKCLLVLGEFDCASAIGCQADDSWTGHGHFFLSVFFFAPTLDFPELATFWVVPTMPSGEKHRRAHQAGVTWTYFGTKKCN